MSRTIVVTGASIGIGAGIAERIVAGGDRVLNLSHVAGLARAAVTDHIADLTDPVALEAAAAMVVASGATGLVHNAGVIRPALLESVKPGDLDYVVDLHLKAAIRLAQAILPAMAAAGSGRIVLIASRAALGLATRTVYSATKAALIGLGRTWALELAPRGITVNIVSPGPIESEMFHELVPEGSDRKAALIRSIPVGRIGRPEDVAAAVSFFLSDEASFVTGQNLFVCGGTSVGSLAL